MCHKLSQTFRVDEAALQEDFIDFKIVLGLKEQFLAAKDDLVLFWATKMPVRFLALREAAQKFLLLFCCTWSCESGFSTMNHIKNSLRCRLTDKRLDERQRLTISHLAPGFSRLSKNLINLFVSVRWTASRSPLTNDWHGSF